MSEELTIHTPRGLAELSAIVEALVFVADEPVAAKALADALDEDKGWARPANDLIAVAGGLALYAATVLVGHQWLIGVSPM